MPPAIPKPQFYNLLPNIQPHVTAAHNTVPAWQHVNGVPNINYNTGPYTPGPPLPWGQQYTAQQPMLQYPPQQCFPTQPPSTNHFPAHGLPSPVLSLPPTPRTTHAPPLSFPMLAGMAPRPPRPVHQQDPCRSPAPPNAPSRYSEYSEMSAMRAAILELAPALYAQSFKDEKTCLFSVVTARKEGGSKFMVALIVYVEENRSRWVNALPGQQYYNTLREGMEALLLTMENAMASALVGEQGERFPQARDLMHYDDIAFEAFLDGNGFGPATGEGGVLMDSNSK